MELVKALVFLPRCSASLPNFGREALKMRGGFYARFDVGFDLFSGRQVNNLDRTPRFSLLPSPTVVNHYHLLVGRVLPGLSLFIAAVDVDTTSVAVEGRICHRLTWIFFFYLPPLGNHKYLNYSVNGIHTIIKYCIEECLMVMVVVRWEVS